SSLSRTHPGHRAARAGDKGYVGLDTSSSMAPERYTTNYSCRAKAPPTSHTTTTTRSRSNTVPRQTDAESIFREETQWHHEDAHRAFDLAGPGVGLECRCVSWQQRQL